ncbi:DUF4153 domain-containing protein [Rhodobacter capsulatus]|uniref:DUF4153 domain-containing protein n=1 Tax=Rhodobacter capsulatus TaxID=1061 RepID=UPI00402625E5
MTKPLLIPGLPRSLARDGWWLDAPVAGPPDAPKGEARSTRGPHWAGLASLVALADLLFWHHAPGLSLALFALAILGVAAAGSGRLSARPVVLLALAAAPVVEHLQALSLAFLALGLAVALVWLRRPEAGMADIMAVTAAWLRRLPGHWLAPLAPRAGVLAQIARPSSAGQSARKALRDWAFPLAGSLVFLGLLMQANPVLARGLAIDLDVWALAARLLFWAGVALLLAPFLASDLPEPLQLSPVALPRAARLGLNPRSVLRALVLFNALIALQSVTDLSILVFGVALPEGMSLAEYAHRGAYPLLATALLAGAFALAARPFLQEHRAIRPLLLVWLAQNMVLCGAAMLRLEHYIEAFGLTYLRLYALIWMGLVAIGLGLVAVQVLRGRSAAWLLTRSSALGLGTLYLCAFVNFAQIIAAQNLARPAPDTGYICALGPMAHGALLDAMRANPGLRIETRPCALWFPPDAPGWREWGFRSWRVARYSAAMETPERAE